VRCLTLPSYESTMRHAIKVLLATFPKASVRFLWVKEEHPVLKSSIHVLGTPLGRDR